MCQVRLILRRFQPTSPVRETTSLQCFLLFHWHISTHVPRAGDDSGRGWRLGCLKNFNPRPPCGRRPSRSVFRHAPRANFNPRPPCGRRHAVLPSFDRPDLFQPTSPVRETTSIFSKDADTARFQPTSPVRETTGRPLWSGPGRCNFNPRPPCGRRRYHPNQPYPIENFNPRPPCGRRQSWSRNSC